MSRYEKRLAELVASQAAEPVKRPEEPMTRTQIENFLRQYATTLSAASRVQIADAWHHDASVNYHTGHQDGRDGEGGY